MDIKGPKALFKLEQSYFKATTYEIAEMMLATDYTYRSLWVE